MKRFLYSVEHLAFLEEGYKQMRVPELTAAFNKKFGMEKSEKAIKCCLTNHGFKCGRTPGNPKGTFSSVTQYQATWLSDHYKNLSQVELTEAFNNYFSLSKTVGQIRAFLKNHGFLSGRTGCFEKNHKPWNTGTKGLVKPNSGNFKKGDVPANIKPLGDERVCSKDGYILIKVAEQNPYTGAPTRYKHKQIVVWEQEHGPVPENHAITFKDDNKLNCELANLECISRAEHCRRNQMKLSSQPAELKPTIKALAKLITKSHKLESDNAKPQK